MNKYSDNIAENKENSTIKIVEKLINKEASKKNKSKKKQLIQILKLLSKAKKTNEVSKTLNLSSRRIQQILKSNLNTTPNAVRKIFIQKKFQETSSIDITKNTANLKNLRKKIFLDSEQITYFLKGIDNKLHKAIALTLIETGCRLNELTNLRKKDLFDNNLSVNKRVNQISVTLKHLLLYAISKSNSEYIFSTRQSNRITDKRIFQIIKYYAKRDNLPRVNPQILRNSFILNHIRKGTPTEKISEITSVKHFDFGHYGIYEKMKK